MMIVIGGRIIPLFTINWLRNQGIQIECVKSFTALDRAALLTTLLLIPRRLFTGASWLTGVMALIAGALNALRLIGWSGWRTAREPLLWILHLGYGWIVVALLLKSAAAFNLAALPLGSMLWSRRNGDSDPGSNDPCSPLGTPAAHSPCPALELRFMQLLH